MISICRAESDGAEAEARCPVPEQLPCSYC
jgi:hypothetical protein